jgi:uncharacterized repeat protein (TIGR03803 family)
MSLDSRAEFGPFFGQTESKDLRLPVATYGTNFGNTTLAAAIQLMVGTTGVASHNLFNSGGTTALSATVSSLPAGGGIIYARLWSQINGVWQYSDYTYLESAASLTLAQGAAESILYKFTGNSTPSTDGWSPSGGMVMDSEGDLYWTTLYGPAVVEGANTISNNGIVFKISPSGQETIQYSFGNSPDGLQPNGGLAIDAAGILYGTTSSGGTQSAGTVFKVAPQGARSSPKKRWNGGYDTNYGTESQVSVIRPS